MTAVAYPFFTAREMAFYAEFDLGKRDKVAVLKSRPQIDDGMLGYTTPADEHTWPTTSIFMCRLEQLGGSIQGEEGQVGGLIAQIDKWVMICAKSDIPDPLPGNGIIFCGNLKFEIEGINTEESYSTVAVISLVEVS